MVGAATLAVALHLTSALVCVLSGSFITMGALEFVANGWRDFVHVAFIGYPGFTAGLAGLCLGVAAGGRAVLRVAVALAAR
ncbi:MAG: hypothetical protein OZ921_21080, partial [Sorangiineae bacterium]|nr:hypothetical protein [Sorangiineae bacterium]